jgi:class 3 adenylate cyclase
MTNQLQSHRIGIIGQALRRLLVLYGGCALVLWSSAAQAVALQDTFTRFNLSQHMGYLVDPSLSLGLEQIRTPEYLGQFVVEGKSEFQRGFSQDAYWAHVTLTNEGERSQWQVVMDYTLMDHLSLYIVHQDGSMEEHVTGDALPFVQRPLLCPNFVFPLLIEPGESLELYLRMASEGSINAPITLWEPGALLEAEGNKRSFRGFYYGGVFILALYNALLFLYFRRPQFLLLSLLLTAGGLIFASFDGLVYQYLWPASPIVNAVSFPVLMFFLSAMGFLLIATFLWTPLKQWEQRLVLGFVSICGIGCLVSPFLSYAVAVRLSVVALISWYFFNFIFGLRVWFRGYKAARMFILSSMCGVVGGLIYSIGTLGYIPVGIASTAGFMGTSAMYVMLSLALTDQIRIVQQMKKNLSDSFAKFVPKKLVSQLLEGGSVLDLGGEEREITVLFSDIQGYSTIVERLEAVQVVSLLSEYFESMQGAVERNNGVIIEFIGDAILAIFGAPSELEDHSAHAVRCALEMQELLIELNQSWEKEGISEMWTSVGLERFSVRIGVHTGKVICGNMGSRATMKYGVVGDAVNVAARLEQLNKNLGTQVLMSNEVLKLLTEDLQLLTKDEGEVLLKGREQPQHIYSIRKAGESGGLPKQLTSG